MKSNNFTNKLNKTGIITVDLIDYVPVKKSVSFDMKPLLYEGLIVREKEFKANLQTVDWKKYQDQYVAVFCSVDTIIPPWSYMLITAYLEGVASRVEFMHTDVLNLQLLKENIESANFDHLKDKKVVVRARTDMPPALYTAVTNKLKPVVKTLMYGEVGLPKVIWKN